MSAREELFSFISSSFRSVWALELLLVLKREDRACTTDELVSMMRASSSVVDNALSSLVAAGLASCEDHAATYMPSSKHVSALVDETERFYRSRPDRVRRLIVAASNPGLAAFSDAFRLKD